MSTAREDFPIRISPYVLMQALNEPIDVAAGAFHLLLSDKREGILDGRLRFRWLPSTAMEFEGNYTGPLVSAANDDVTLRIVKLGVDVPALVTRTTLFSNPQPMLGILKEAVTITTKPTIDRLCFCLVNFPDYHGVPFQWAGGFSAGRLQVATSAFLCVVDQIPEMRELRVAAGRDAGFVISHVGELRPLQSPIEAARANDLLDMLRLFFGFLRGAWSGPVFPQGFSEQQKSWEQFAAWRVGEAREVYTWLPQCSRLELSPLFGGFLERWSDPSLWPPLRTALSWHIEANSKRVAPETSIVLAPVALELLAWVELVENCQYHSRRDFDRLSAAGRIRALLHHLKIPAAVPSHLEGLQTLHDKDAFDGPGIILRLRNALVHATENSRALISSLSGLQLWQAGQLALQYLDLCILALCGYQGKYAQRAWQGWKGEDEIVVPWARASE